MAAVKAKVTVKSGKPASGTLLARQHVVIVKNNAKAKPYGQPIYQTKAKMTAHFYYGQRPAKTQLRRAN